MQWVPFCREDSNHQPLPPEHRCVLLMLPSREDWCTLPPAVAVGYLKFAAGDKTCPYFVIPGVGGLPTHWCDCLGDDFHAPLWKSGERWTKLVQGR